MRPFVLAFACGVLLACPGGVPLPFEGRWTGTLVRDFECASMGGSSSDVAVDWNIVRSGDALGIRTTEQDCPNLAANLLPGSEDEARLEVAHCETTRPGPPDGGVQDLIINTRTWTDGRLRLRGGGSELLVDAWEHDEGTAGKADGGGVPYICDGLSFGALALED